MSLWGSHQPFRFSLLNSTGSATSYSTNQVFTTTANNNHKKQSLLPVCNVSEPGFYSGSTMVVQQPGDLQWQTNCLSNLQNINTMKCLQKGLGAILSESVNRGSEIMLTAEYLPGRLKVSKDWAFRNFQDSSEWLLSPGVFQEICVRWRFPELDLFASRACHQILSYLSWKTDLHSLAANAFQQNWKHRGLLYAFPPFSMIGKVLLKVKTEEVDAFLITSSWLAQPWYSQVLELSVTKLLLLPRLSNILVNPQGQVHPLVVNKTVRLQCRCFPVKFAKFLRAPILKSICERILLNV